MSQSCEWCGYGLQPEQPIHADCARKRVAELEAAISAALHHAEKNGMQKWPVFVKMRKVMKEI